MSQVRLYLNLSSQLVLHIWLHQLLLIENLKSNDKLALLFPRKVYVPKFPMAKRFSNLKVIDSPLFGRPLLALSFLFWIVLLIGYGSRHCHILHCSIIFIESMLFVDRLLLITELVVRRGKRMSCRMDIFNCAILSRVKAMRSMRKLIQRLESLIFSTHCITLDRHFEHLIFAYSLPNATFITCLDVWYLALTLQSIESLFDVLSGELSCTSKMRLRWHEVTLKLRSTHKALLVAVAEELLILVVTLYRLA